MNRSDALADALGLAISGDKLALIVLAFFAALAFALLLVPLSMRLAERLGVVDQPHARRVHTKPTPRWGGLGMYAAFALAVGLMLFFHDSLSNNRVWGLLVGATLMTALGALDDKFQIPAWAKLLGQLLAAALVTLDVFGLRMVVLLDWDLPKWLGVTLSVVWIVGVTNTINLIDGLDGLAAGVSAIATFTFLVIALVAMESSFGFVLLTAALVGTCAGFLRFNFHPAKVFMGDAGSHFLGFTIAALSILQNWEVAAAAALAVPLLILAVPIFDTVFAIIRRLWRRQPIFMPDRGHLHHRLLALGMNQRLVVLTIYVLTGLGCTAAVWLALWR
ncbi:MAG TPA: MraY family glycosyltransferase [Armatimonadota bacterium]|nr:MraY family glycosyltransferase [Armatimonadota bacterium]